MKTVADAVGYLVEALRDDPVLESAIAHLESGDGPAPGEMRSDTLLARAAVILGSSAPADVVGLTPWIALLRDCDLWHASLCTGVWSKEDGLALERADAHLARYGRLNSDYESGSVVTRHAVMGIWSDGIVDGELALGRDWPNSFLHFLTFIPAELEAHGPDFGSDRTSGNRTVKMRFHRVVADAPIPRLLPIRERPIQVGVAPLLTELCDINVPLHHGRHGRSWYHIEPLVSDELIEKAITGLAEAGTEILIIPECAVNSRQLPFIGKLLASLSNRAPIALSILGTATIPTDNAGFARNQAVLLDRYGREIVRNDKLIRWNLNQRERTNLNFEEPNAADMEFLYENICPGDTVTLVEYPSIGRLMTLVCADLIALLPSDWIRKHLCLDWTFTPLLDSSMEVRRWMGKEAERAAAASRGRVVVANSMTLQKRYKIINPGATDECGILITVDGRLGPARAVVDRVACSSPSDVFLTHIWASCSESEAAPRSAD